MWSFQSVSEVKVFLWGLGEAKITYMQAWKLFRTFCLRFFFFLRLLLSFGMISLLPLTSVCRTYDECEFKPGESLNVVLGPNGKEVT